MDRQPHDHKLQTLGYSPTDPSDRLKLRRRASGTTHYANSTDRSRFYRVTILGSDCLMAIDMPAVAACGVRLQGGEVVVMEAATKVGCAGCRRAVTPS